jgi:hypothetical protein
MLDQGLEIMSQERDMQYRAQDDMIEGVDCDDSENGCASCGRAACTSNQLEKVIMNDETKKQPTSPADAAAKTPSPEFDSIASRWKTYSEGVGIEQLPDREKAIAAAVFFAGFKAGVGAMTELGAYEDHAAMYFLKRMIQDSASINSAGEALLRAVGLNVPGAGDVPH